MKARNCYLAPTTSERLNNNLTNHNLGHYNSVRNRSFGPHEI